MNTLSSQFTSLDMSKRLAEAGFKAESFFKWVRWKEERYGSTEWELIYHNTNEHKLNMFCDYLDAFHFQQLWEALPDTSVIEFGLKGKTIFADELDYTGNRYRLRDFRTNYLPDTVGESVLWCIEQGYISVEGNDDQTNRPQ